MLAVHGMVKVTRSATADVSTTHVSKACAGARALVIRPVTLQHTGATTFCMRMPPWELGWDWLLPSLLPSSNDLMRS